jgi:hypothetical protein
MESEYLSDKFDFIVEIVWSDARAWIDEKDEIDFLTDVMLPELTHSLLQDASQNINWKKSVFNVFKFKTIIWKKPVKSFSSKTSN